MSIYDITSIYVFRADLLVLDSKLMSFFLGRVTSARSIAQLAVVLCVELRPSGLFPVQLGMFVVLLFIQSIFEAHGF